MNTLPSTTKPTGVASPSYQIKTETEDHLPAIDKLHCDAFGPGRFTRAAFRVREQGDHDNSLSFVAVDGDHLLASVRLTWIVTSKSKSLGLLLGPLAVTEQARNSGIGRALVAHCVQVASQTKADYLMLVGDQPYYGPLGFEVAPKGQVSLPGPVDTNRLLVHPLNEFDVGRLVGEVRHAGLG